MTITKNNYNQLTTGNTRIKWLDVLKFIGILEIYLAHFGDVVGYSYLFAYSHHVALFFFIMGCVEYYNKEKFFPTILKKIKTILIPFFIFCIMAIIFGVLLGEVKYENLKSLLLIVIKGVERNSFIALSLWFLSAAFVISLIFQVIKLVKNKFIMLTIALIIQYFSSTILSIDFLKIFNINWAIYYLIYFIVGYCLIEIIQIILNSTNKNIKIVHYSFFCITAIFTFLLFFQKNILDFLFNIKFLNKFAEPLVAIFPIMFFVFLSYQLRNIDLFSEMGKDTLYHCGNEYIVKGAVSQILIMFGLNFNIYSPFSGLFAAFILLFIVSKLFVPWQKKIINHILDICFKKTK